MHTVASLIDEFLASSSIAVVGAGNDLSKYGAKVFAAYQAHGIDALPVNPREALVQGKKAYPSLTALPERVAHISIITPPPVTEKVVEEAAALGARILWMQPGAESLEAIKRAEELGMRVLAGGPCVLVELPKRPRAARAMRGTADVLRPYGTSVFSEMTKLANEHQAVNLAQGFPNFDGPRELIEAAVWALRSGENQYSRSLGHGTLVEAISNAHQRYYGLRYDPMTEVGVYNGATEGIAAAVLGLVNPGDEVILFEPFYDSYPALVERAGGVPRFCTLRFPAFELPREELQKLFGLRTRLLILNSPHNPTGKVFAREELQFIAELCRRHDVIVLADEVYEHITFDGVRHIPMASIEGMRERTLALSSSGKTFSCTGWKIGWGTGPAHLVQAAQAAHQFLTFCAVTPLQVAVGRALSSIGDNYYQDLRASYTERRDYLLGALRECGFEPVVPKGTYFILASFAKLSAEDDRTFARRLVREARVAAIPPSAFYRAHPEEARHLLRFAFCKTPETLAAARERMLKLRG